MIRRVSFILTAFMGAACLVSACQEPTRYRVLSFFFDGVPEPGAISVKGYAANIPAGAEDMPDEAAKRAAPRPFYPHTPYRENRCRACHSRENGQTFKSPQEGLCRTCHPDVPGRAPYVHGPVAVDECLYCHHHHGSSYPKMLLADGAELCFRCHRREDLTEGPHHATLDLQPCIECHDPHAGNNRFFLKRTER